MKPLDRHEIKNGDTIWVHWLNKERNDSRWESEGNITKIFVRYSRATESGYICGITTDKIYVQTPSFENCNFYSGKDYGSKADIIKAIYGETDERVSKGE